MAKSIVVTIADTFKLMVLGSIYIPCNVHMMISRMIEVTANRIILASGLFFFLLVLLAENYTS
jgi:hypothetical protein